MLSGPWLLIQACPGTSAGQMEKPGALRTWALWEILSIDPGAQCSPDALPVEGGAWSQWGALDAPTEQCLMCPRCPWGQRQDGW